MKPPVAFSFFNTIKLSYRYSERLSIFERIPTALKPPYFTIKMYGTPKQWVPCIFLLLSYL